MNRKDLIGRSKMTPSRCFHFFLFLWTSSASVRFVAAVVENNSSNDNTQMQQQQSNDLLSVNVSSSEHDVTSTNSHSSDSENDDKSTRTYSPLTRAPSFRTTFTESIQYYRKLFQDPDLEKIRSDYWKETLDDIRALASAGGFNDRFLSANVNETSSPGFFNQWKLALFDDDDDDDDTTTIRRTKTNEITGDVNETTASDASVVRFWQRRNEQRFEGFPSYERLLQDWYDEIQDYLGQVESEEKLGYSMSNYGRPPAVVKYDATTNASAVDETSSTETSVLTKSELSHYLPASVRDTGDGTDDFSVLEKDSFQTTAKSTTTTSEKKPALPIPEPAKPGQEVLPHTDVADKSKRILIVTTAAMPWRTGTAVNPLLRAAYLTEGRAAAGGSVTLMIPWLERPEDQERVYGKNQVFKSSEEQTTYIQNWLRNDAKMSTAADVLQIRWYTAWHSKIENSIYSMGDITALVGNDEIDICILEEPEHLNWYRAPGESWTKKFPHVVGILHTNYFSYALDQPAALIRAPAMRLLCSWMCRAHCHRIIKLSGTLDKMAPEKELVENVHGVRETFLDVGQKVRQRLHDTSPRSWLTTTDTTSNSISTDPIFGAEVDPKIYFIGKLLWSKGLGSLMELLKYAEESAGIKGVRVDMYGGGPDMEAAKSRANKLGLDMPFHGPLDHAELAFTHKIFVNPSTSEVLCTTSAEALAMGKFVILPSHPSNDFFLQFPNCLTYATKEEFVGNLYYAMTHSPVPLTDVYLHALSWEAANERLIAAACIPKEEDEQMKKVIAANEAAIEISLPPLIDADKNPKARESLATVLQYTRLRYRQFRQRLSTEIKSTRVLPKPIGERLVAELDKRLDLDIDEVLESPKLRIKLSPAELDKQLLELYDTISESPGGDVLRILGGGGQIGLQNLYLKRHAERERWRKLNNKRRANKNQSLISLLPSFTVEEVLTEEFQRSASQWVRYSLRKNQQKLAKSLNLSIKRPKSNRPDSDEQDTVLASAKTINGKDDYDETTNHNTPKMSYRAFSRTTTTRHMSGLCTWNGLCHKSPPRRGSKFSLLI